MRLVVQRAAASSVRVDERTYGQITAGLVVLVGVHVTDDEAAVAYCADKAVHLRIFADREGRMNRSLLDTGAAMLAISQFTLYGDCRKGRRPGYSEAAPPDVAEGLYEHFIQRVESHGIHVEHGLFGAHMTVQITNDGPVTLIIESPHP